MKTVEKKRNNIILLIAAIFSCLVAFVNKYPLVYPDTGAYIYSGFNGIIFDDRPIFYGLFLRHISLAASLWLVVFVQGLVVCWLIYTLLEIFILDVKRDYVFIFIITILTLFTGFSYTVSIITPDVFSSISVLSAVNLILNNKLDKFKTFVISILFVFSICTQFSSLAIFALFFAAFAIYFFVRKVRKIEVFLQVKKVLFIFYLFLAGFTIILASNYFYSHKLKISGGSHVFIMNHFIETGVLQAYLKENCGSHNYRICEYKDNLGWDFIWSEDSPLQRTGGWKANEIEYNHIIRDILTTPEYLVLLSQKSIEYTFKQFFTFDVQVSSPQLNPSAPYHQINWRFKNTIHEYLSSLQSNSKLKLEVVNIFQPILVLMSVVFLILVTIKRDAMKLTSELRWTIIIILVYSVTSSFVCSNLSTVDSRFQNRIVWLFPMLAIIVLLNSMFGARLWRNNTEN